uniref:Uncharacterized protein n=1 Tax=Lepeophtheirus salmonis TaxID=72036 RepID=A0A0K2V4K3_LEPSM
MNSLENIRKSNSTFYYFIYTTVICKSLRPSLIFPLIQ